VFESRRARHIFVACLRDYADFAGEIVEEHAGHALVGTVSVAVERMAEDIARDALADETFRRALRELVRVRSQELLDRLLQNGRSNKPAAKRRQKRH
jgi:hypothetical protein